MIKKLYIMGLAVIGLLSSCEKDTITNSYFDDNPERTARLTQEFKQTIQNSKNGWVMMVKSSLSNNVYSPVVLKFDTVTNKVNITTVYGYTDPADSYFNISAGIGSPQITFTTGSVMTSFFRIGAMASDITDHVYNVVKVSADTLEIRGYRSGRVYTKEGGVIYKMFKRPDNWTWADADRYFDLTTATGRTGLVNRDGDLVVKYADGSPGKTFLFRIGVWPDAQVVAYQARDPFVTNISAKGFLPMYTPLVDYYEKVPGSTNTTLLRFTCMFGQNAFSFYPFTYNANTNQNVIAFKDKIKTHYLIAKEVRKNGTNVDIDFVAYDQKGNEAVTATYTLR